MSAYKKDRFFITNITQDEIIQCDAGYSEHPLHMLTCDGRSSSDKVDFIQEGFVVTQKQLAQIKEFGYCDAV